MKAEFWSTEEDRLIDWKELQDEKYKIIAGCKDEFVLFDTSREDDDGYEWEMLGEWRLVV